MSSRRPGTTLRTTADWKALVAADVSKGLIIKCSAGGIVNFGRYDPFEVCDQVSRLPGPSWKDAFGPRHLRPVHWIALQMRDLFFDMVATNTNDAPRRRIFGTLQDYEIIVGDFFSIEQRVRDHFKHRKMPFVPDDLETRTRIY